MVILAPLITGHVIQSWHNAKNRFTMGMLCKLPFIVIRHRSRTKVMVNKQCGVADSKYVVISTPLLTGHVIKR